MAGEDEIAALSFEQALAELERIVAELESGKTDLEQSIDAYERGAQAESPLRGQTEGGSASCRTDRHRAIGAHRRRAGGVLRPMSPAPVAQRVAEIADTVTVALDELLPRAEGPESRLTEAMRYAALGPGKRLRPFFAARDRPDVRSEGAGRCCAPPARWSASTPTAWCTTTCRAWTTTTCGAAARPCTGPTTRRPPCWPATRCRPSPSRSWPIRTPIRTAACAPSWCDDWPSRRAPAAWPAAR